MNDILFNILQAVIIAAVAAVARYLIPFVREKLAQSRYAWLLDVVDAAVRGVEQTFGAGHGTEKKKAALSYLADWLTTHQVQITAAQLNQLVEAAVNTMNTERGKYDETALVVLPEGDAPEEDDGR